MESLAVPRRRPRSEDHDTESGSPATSQASSAKRPRLNPADNENEDSQDDSGEDEATDTGTDHDDSAVEQRGRDGNNEEDTAQDDDAEAQTSEDEVKQEEGADGEDYADGSDGESEASGASEAIANPPQVAPHSGLGPGGYKPGAIVRIKVTNFVTYTSAEFFPGPKLNMVIGPNGTGKSTLVCAICLGLGWGPKHLGRAKDLGEFVKHGSKEAIIEIELCGPPKQGHNPIIQRTIKKDGNKSSFLLDGRTASSQEVLKLAQSFAIQVDNLCQFLPQDKVAEFAALTPVQLLHSTQRAAAGPEMLARHEELKAIRTRQKNLELKNGGDRDTLTNLENRQEMQRADVERMRERAAIENKINILKKMRPLVEWKDHKEAYQSLGETKQKVQEEYDKLKNDLAPVLRAVEIKNAYIEELNGAKDDRKDAVHGASKVATRLGNLIDEFDHKIKDIDGKIDAERKSGHNHKTDAAKAKQTINKLKRRQEEEAVEFDPETFNETLREQRLHHRQLESKISEIVEEISPIKEEMEQRKRSIGQAKHQLENLNTATGRQELKLEQISRDSLTAYKWLLENQDKFKQEVFGPPIVTCSIKDPKYADAVEHLFQNTDLTTFTTQSREDFRTLQQYLNGHLKLSDVTIRTCSQSLADMKPPMSDGQLHRLGLDGWAKDFLAGPDTVIAMLCAEKSMHKTPIAANDISEELFATLEQGGLGLWVVGKTSYQVTRRKEYGPGATITKVRTVSPAKHWTAQPVNQELRQKHEENIVVLNEELAELNKRFETFRTRGVKLREEAQDTKQKMDAIEQEKMTKQTAYTQYRAIPEKISQQQAKLDNTKLMFERVRETVRQFRNEQDGLAIEKAEAAVNYADAVEQFRQAYEELMKIEIHHLEATSDVQTLRLRNLDSTRLVEEKRKELVRITEEMKTSKAKAMELRRLAKSIIDEVSQLPGGREMVEGLNDHDTAQLEADIESEVARLQFTHGGSDHMIQEFEERERTIEKLRSKLAEFQTELDECSLAIAEVRKEWEPRLEALIEKISDAFSDSFRRIGCAGQVTLGKAETEPGPNGEPGVSEFADWSIVIHVAFRQDAPLSVLNSHRQSGGERAVSTIFYLMALQSLSASPFRVVDEINQGMDPRNERMVHGRLVEIACASSEADEVDGNGNPIGGGGGGQYFLITPKLLNGLAYKRGMRVLCIYSGEHMPQDYAQINFKEAIRKMAAMSKGTSIQSAPVYA